MTDQALDDKALRKAWLKQKFGSFEYHEEMLELHKNVLRVIEYALLHAELDSTAVDPAAAESRKDRAAYFRKRYLPLMLENDDLGKYERENWHTQRHSATFRSVPDYNRYLYSEEDALDWLTHDEQVELGKHWGPMSKMAQNIKYTVDNRWEEDPDDRDWMLDEKYTGPITYPPDWRSQVLGPQGEALFQKDAVRITAGRPAPQSGLWRALDPQASELRANAGESLPDLGSSYGLTVWQRVGD